MSSVEFLREFLSERLSAAAEEIFRVVSKTIVEYQEEIERQREQLDLIWKPAIKLHRIELPQHHVFEEEEMEVPAQQHLCTWSSSHQTQKQPEPQQVKEEQKESSHSEAELKSDPGLLTLSVHVAESQQQREIRELPQQQVCRTEEKKEVPTEHLCTQESSSSQDQEPLQVKEEEGEICTNQEGLNSHLEDQMRVHTGEMLSCETCGKRFVSIFDLRLHTREHKCKISYVCIRCQKTFSNAQNLNKHILAHTGERPHLCKTCGRSFKVLSHLKVHLRTHTGEKPYVCTICQRTFRQISTLNKHTQMHTREGRYICNICPSRFDHFGTLTRHLAIHNREGPHA